MFLSSHLLVIGAQTGDEDPVSRGGLFADFRDKKTPQPEAAGCNQLAASNPATRLFVRQFVLRARFLTGALS